MLEDLKQEVNSECKLNTGKVILETINNLKYDCLFIPGILVKNHGTKAYYEQGDRKDD